MAVLALAMIAWAGLSAWRGWLDLRRAEIERGETRAATPARDLKDIRERIRRLEAIADGMR